jgi:hypothetical protein
MSDVGVKSKATSRGVGRHLPCHQQVGLHMVVLVIGQALENLGAGEVGEAPTYDGVHGLAVSLARRRIAVVGGAYFSLPNGPITSEFLDLVNSGRLFGEEHCRWEELISDRQNREWTRTDGP